MTVAMPCKTTAAKAGAKGATKVARNPTARRAATPAAKASWFVGKKFAKRKAKKHARGYGDAARTTWSAALIYGPMAAEVLGVVSAPDSCTSRTAAGTPRVRTRDGHDARRVTRHRCLAVMTAERRCPPISPACRLPPPGRSFLSPRRHLARDSLGAHQARKRGIRDRAEPCVDATPGRATLTSPIRSSSHWWRGSRSSRRGNRRRNQAGVARAARTTSWLGRSAPLVILIIRRRWRSR